MFAIMMTIGRIAVAVFFVRVMLLVNEAAQEVCDHSRAPKVVYGDGGHAYVPSR